MKEGRSFYRFHWSPMSIKYTYVSKALLNCLAKQQSKIEPASNPSGTINTILAGWLGPWWTNWIPISSIFLYAYRYRSISSSSSRQVRSCFEHARSVCNYKTLNQKNFFFIILGWVGPNWFPAAAWDQSHQPGCQCERAVQVLASKAKLCLEHTIWTVSI